MLSLSLDQENVKASGWDYPVMTSLTVNKKEVLILRAVTKQFDIFARRFLAEFAC